MQEIKRSCNLPEIQEAVNYPKEDVSGVLGFRALVQKRDYDGIYELLRIDNSKEKIKKILRKILIKL